MFLQVETAAVISVDQPTVMFLQVRSANCHYLQLICGHSTELRMTGCDKGHINASDHSGVC
jgi:ribosomal protein S27E